MMPNAKIITANNWTQVYLILKEHILQRKFGPNEKIAIPELARQLGVSPTPIRDALNRLESEGLIRTVPKVGTFVAPITPEHVIDLIETRLMMEYWVVDKWTTLSEKSIAVTDMLANVAKAEELLTPQTIEQYKQSELDLSFHLTLLRVGGNPRMIEIYETTMNYRIFNLAGEMLTIDMYKTTAAQHRDIAEALANGDCERAKQAIRAHLDFSKHNLLTFISQSGGHI
ncbi:unnamed protein product [Aphanomyces euteiches]